MSMRRDDHPADDFAVANLSRRGFLKGLAATSALVVAASWGMPEAFAAKKKQPLYGGDAMPHGVVDDPKVFISIGTDGLVTFVCNRAEMGQGVRTSLAMVVADELEADWAMMRVAQAPGDEQRYGNQDTDGSRSMRHWFEPLRRCGAAARQMLEQHFVFDGRRVPVEVLSWLQRETVRHAGLDEGPVPGSPSLVLEASLSGRRLRFTLHEAAGDGQWLLVLREADDAAALEALALAFVLTPREAEALYWVARGKTNRDIGEIVGASPATVKKHLEHVYEKLGVETRNAAAALAVARVPQIGR